jgi:hypothetical protein
MRSITPLLSPIWQAYLCSLQERPLTTKASFAALIFFTSDSATQYLTYRQRRGRRHDNNNDCHRHNDEEEAEAFQFQASRALSGASFGIVAATWMHYWWNWLEIAVATSPRLPAVFRNHKLCNALTKVMIDQAVGAPIYVYTYYVVTNFLGNFASSLSDSNVGPSKLLLDTHGKASEMLWPTMLQHWRIWPAVHAINFYFMPLNHRVLVQNTVLVGWSGYLSFLNNNVNNNNNNNSTLLQTTASHEIQTLQRRESSLLRLREGARTSNAKAGCSSNEAEVSVS